MNAIREWLRGNEDERRPAGWDIVINMARNGELHQLGSGNYGRIHLVCVDMNTGEVMEADDALVFMKDRKERKAKDRNVLCFALKETRQAYEGKIKKSSEADIVDAIIAYRDRSENGDGGKGNNAHTHGIMYFADTYRDEERRRDYIAMEIVSKSISHLMKENIQIYGEDTEKAMRKQWTHWMNQFGEILNTLHQKIGIYHLDVNMNNIMLRRKNEDGIEYELVLGDFGHAEFKHKLLEPSIWGTEGRRMIETDEDRMLLKSLTKNENAEKWVLFDTLSLSEVEKFLERKGRLAEIWIELEADGLEKKNMPRMEYKDRLFRKIWDEGLYEEILKKRDGINYLGFVKTWGAEGIMRV